MHRGIATAVRLAAASGSPHRAFSSALPAQGSFSFGVMSVKQITFTFSSPDSATYSALPTSFTDNSPLLTVSGPALPLSLPSASASATASTSSSLTPAGRSTHSQLERSSPVSLLSAAAATRIIPASALEDLDYFPRLANSALHSPPNHHTNAHGTPQRAGQGKERFLVSKRALKAHLERVHARDRDREQGVCEQAQIQAQTQLRALSSTSASESPSGTAAIVSSQSQSAASSLASVTALAPTTATPAPPALLHSIASAPSSSLSSLSESSNLLTRQHYAGATARSEPLPAPALTPALRSFIRHCALGDLARARAVLLTAEGRAEVTATALALARVERGGGALHHAAAGGHCDVLTMLLDEFAVPVDVRAANDSSALHWAAGNGQESAVALLLARGADPRARSSTWCVTVMGKSSGQTALHWAAESGHTRCVELLCAAAPETVGAVDEKDATPLELAKKEGIHAVTVGRLEQILDEEYVCVVMGVEEAVVTRALGSAVHPQGSDVTPGGNEQQQQQQWA